MAPHKMNVLVYTGPGTSSESVKHCLFSLRQLLAPTYAVNPVGENHLLKEPWAATCALLVFPGGADLGYCRVLNGAGNRSITQYVRAGGRYFGFCAGSYYGSNRCEFEVGNAPLEVVGSRELAFFPGTCRGGAFKGFQYHSEKGARAIRLTPSKQLQGAGRLPPSLRCYHNGGGVFVDAAQFEGQDIKVLASYADTLDVDGGDGQAAIVYCTVGKGAAVLTGPHIEFASANLTPQPDIPAYGDLLQAVKEDDEHREELLRQCLSSLGLAVNQVTPPVPELTPLHVTCLHPDQAAELWHSWQDIIKKEGTRNVIKGGTDTFSVRLADTQKRSSKSQPPNGRDEKNVFTSDITPVLQELLLGSQQHPSLMKAAARIDGNHESEEDFNYLHNFLEQLSHKMGTDAPRGLLSSEGTRHIAHILTRTVADPKMEAFLEGSNDSSVADVNSSGGLDILIKQVTSNLGLVNIGSDDKIGQRFSKSENDEGANKMIDYAAVVKELIVHEHGVPGRHETPFFNHEVYYRALENYRQTRDHKAEDWGDSLMYGEVLTSTNTVLDQNHGLLATLPSGFTVVARTQVAGRGRGSNVWIAPPGQMIFSSVINHSYKLAASRPIIFINYLAAIATAEGIRGLRPGCKDIPVKLKWPNDIYIQKPGKDASLNESYVKIGGLLFQCSYSDGNYQVVAGIGVNAVNDRPTTCVKNYLPAGKDGCETLVEELIASILCRFEMLYKEFCRTGFSEDLEARYYAHWLHTDQIVTLEAEGGVRARIRGITRDWGLLRAEELGTNDAPTGRFWALQSDENSFDFLKGLVRRKL